MIINTVAKPHQGVKCLRNKNVFNRFLKLSTEVAFFKAIGRAFHSVGATTENALSPLVLRFEEGMVKRPLSEDRRVLMLGF